MHPAKSVIFFTTASGAGYGLFILLAAFAALGWLPADRWFGFTAFSAAFLLVTGGLASSTFHLGHPERAWRALSQWRSSWLSREGVAAFATYLPMGLFGATWVIAERYDGAVMAIGLLGAVACFITVYCTSMIYASLKTIEAWSNRWTIAGYLVFSVMTGALILNVFVHLWQFEQLTSIHGAVLVSLGLGIVVKWQYWRYIDATQSRSTAGTATGLGKFGSPRLLDAPHTEENYIMAEMGFRVARRHAAKLRRITLIAGFFAPFTLTVLAVFTGGVIATGLVILAALSGTVGIVIERWLFFAEAKHVVTLYYGESRA
ncbi:MAG: dimethyl sulfoxide reductase anchor subunit [Rhodospirillales bacterium]|nr:dimethyl sulfoxide reductase anchor subunit [Rhodospirillales bacterium]